MNEILENAYMESIGEAVDAEWLNNFLGASKPLGVWVAGQIKNNELIEGVDYLRKRLPTENGGSSVSWMMTIPAAMMIAMSDKGAVGRRARHQYAAQVASLSPIDSASLKPKEGAYPVARKPIMMVAKPREKRTPERIPPIMLKTMELPDENMTIASFASLYVGAGHNSVTMLLYMMFNLGHVDYMGWPTTSRDWLYVSDDALYINPKKSAEFVKYRMQME